MRPRTIAILRAVTRRKSFTATQVARYPASRLLQYRGAGFTILRDIDQWLQSCGMQLHYDVQPAYRQRHRRG